MWSERDSHVDQGPAEVPKDKLLFGFGFYRMQGAECCVGGCIEAGRYTCLCFCFLSDMTMYFSLPRLWFCCWVVFFQIGFHCVSKMIRNSVSRPCA